ncbi:FecR family protein [Rufibacter quisquiliarum]|uniref:Ferric-dicitrate binding protein FerR (Iron transport regulator) n=1 Tax=Rufibacter quisquiliarum TaxID=1549639 RepID=A0A839GXX0_9BACT|nr:FecR domain-containing protein [Rufibacter quisquiliarum]MBA9079298.1 ferric-dicitrate binding protein FerR (iron transport regulator) [Rufibacter quisquiliarum]
MSKKDISDLLDRYLAEECTPEEAQQVEAWLANLQQEKNQWQKLGEPEREQLLSSVFANIKNTISPEARVVQMPVRNRWRMISALAAAFLIGALVYTFWGQLVQNRNEQEAYVAVQAQKGHRKRLTLPDGTHLWLNAGSSLKYPVSFNQKNREVFLEGEGFFEVAHNPEKPFVVRTGSLSTKVLGTVFNVNAYPEKETVQVTLVSGRVLLEQNQQELASSMELAPRQAATFSKKSGNLSRQEVRHVEEFYAWTEGRLVFQETPLQEALLRLERAYGVSLAAEGQVANCTITGTFKVEQPLAQVMQIISISTGGTFAPAGAGGVLHGAGCD